MGCGEPSSPTPASKCFADEDFRLVKALRGHRKIRLCAVPGKKDGYRRLGFRRLRTAMAIFADPAAATARGYLDEA